MINEIKATNGIESINSTRHDIYYVMNSSINNSKNKKIRSITNQYKLLLENKTFTLSNLSDIRNTYNSLLNSCIEKEDLPDGEYFRKNRIYIGNGLQNIHMGIEGEKNIEIAMNDFLKIYNSNNEIYLKLIISHFMFEYIHPFYDGNGRLGRYIFSGGLYNKTKSYFSFLIASAFANEKSKYYKSLKLASDKHEYHVLNSYVKVMLEIILDELKNSYTDLEKKTKEIDEFIFNDKLSNKEKIIFNLIIETSVFSTFGISNLELIKYSNVSKRTIIYFINKLKEKNLLDDTKIGKCIYHKIKRINC